MPDAIDPARLLPEVASPRELRRQYERHQLTMGVAVALTSLVAIGAVALTFDSNWLARRWPQAAVAALLPLLPAFRLVREMLRRKKTPVDQAMPEELGEYTRAELQQLFDEIRARFAGRETPTLYVVPNDSADAHASTINALLLGNLLRPMNAVYITPGLLHLMRRDELRAVLAHELAHFYGLMSLPRGIMGLVVAVLAAFSVALVQGLALSSWWAVVGIALGVRFIGAVVPAYVMRQVDHLEEYLSDHEAARLVGHVPIINALLRLELRDELMTDVLYRVVRATEERPGLDLVAVMRQLGERIPDQTVQFSEVEPLIDELLAEHAEAAEAATAEIDDSRRQAIAESLRELRTAYLEKKNWKKISWDAFDTIVPDGQLDEQEVRGYLEALARDPEAVIAHTDAEVAVGDEPTTHPKTRQRIIFLAREFVFGPPAAGPRI